MILSSLTITSNTLFFFFFFYKIYSNPGYFSYGDTELMVKALGKCVRISMSWGTY